LINNNNNNYNEKRKLNSILLISLSISIFLFSIIFLSTNEENSIFKLSLGQEIKHTVPLDKIVSDGPPQDGIPSIDNPNFNQFKKQVKF
jgi:hypothetical protein